MQPDAFYQDIAERYLRGEATDAELFAAEKAAISELGEMKQQRVGTHAAVCNCGANL